MGALIKAIIVNQICGGIFDCEDQSQKRPQFFIRNEEIDVITAVHSFDDQSDSPAAVYLAPNVYLLSVADGTARLLDLDGAFYSLSQTAAKMLFEVLTKPLDEAVPNLTKYYKADQKRIQGDINAFLDNLLRRKLITLDKVARGEKNRLSNMIFRILMNACLTVINASIFPTNRRAGLLMTLIYVSLRLKGWNITVNILKNRYSIADHSDTVLGGMEKAMAIDLAVRAASSKHLLNITCKERSLCCWVLMRAKKLTATLVLGIDLMPLASHCWCQFGGQILTDYEDRCERFVPIILYT